MKKIIRFIVKISGVQQELEEETTKRIGESMNQYSYWFNELPKTKKAFQLYAGFLKDGHEQPYGSHLQQIRDAVYEENN